MTTMVQTIYRIAKMTSFFAGIIISLFLLSIALPHRWIIFQFVVFVILKLCSVKKNGDAGAAVGGSDYGHLLEAWYDELYPSSHAAAASDNYTSRYEEPLPPEVVKEVLLEEDVPPLEEEEREDVHEVLVASMDETWRAIMAGRRRGGAQKTTSGTWERYRLKVEEGAAWATSAGARRETELGISEATYKKKLDQVNIKARRPKKKKEEECLAVWRRPREVLSVGHDELYRRVEAFIRMQHDHLRLQQRESERRRFLERLQQAS